ncbi:hypothetical protein GQ43DRAFT_431934 [Delitschia confertaspora ATCC 74209]|uniref:Uncharacterized protein n=1 Tax=Delitschia confertaspora ATCC 74209 TaxID=1513339 RepID=A0A9P4JMT8_9PLEO|nr:hypothetical protein GQ43DRAFT_431934 [Delitschia confertaspora ATCC 74209]
MDFELSQQNKPVEPNTISARPQALQGTERQCPEELQNHFHLWILSPANKQQILDGGHKHIFIHDDADSRAHIHIHLPGCDVSSVTSGLGVSGGIKGTGNSGNIRTAFGPGNPSNSRTDPACSKGPTDTAKSQAPAPNSEFGSPAAPADKTAALSVFSNNAAYDTVLRDHIFGNQISPTPPFSFLPPGPPKPVTGLNYSNNPANGRDATLLSFDVANCSDPDSVEIPPCGAPNEVAVPFFSVGNHPSAPYPVGILPPSTQNDTSAASNAGGNLLSQLKPEDRRALEQRMQEELQKYEEQVESIREEVVRLGEMDAFEQRVQEERQKSKERVEALQLETERLAEVEVKDQELQRQKEEIMRQEASREREAARRRRGLAAKPYVCINLRQRSSSMETQPFGHNPIEPGIRVISEGYVHPGQVRSQIRVRSTSSHMVTSRAVQATVESVPENAVFSGSIAPGGMDSTGNVATTPKNLDPAALVEYQSSDHTEQEVSNLNSAAPKVVDSVPFKEA